MKQTKMLRTLGIALSLALLVAIMPATPALAEDLYIHPDDEAEIGEEVQIWGAEFLVVTDYDVYFSGDRASTNDEIDTEVINYEYIKEISTATDGTFTGEYFNIPNTLGDGDEDVRVRGGTYWVYLTRANDEIIKARVAIEVLAVGEITRFDPDDGPVGTEVEIRGEGYGDREDLIVEYDGSDITDEIVTGEAETDSDGDFEFTILIPESTAGAHTVTVIGDDSNIELDAEFTVEPSISVSPESGAPGSTVTVSGTGFGDEVNFTVSLNNVEMDIKSGGDETDDDGSFEVTFTVPPMAAGTYDIYMQDDDDNEADAEFTMAEATASISPTTGFVGNEVTASGSGFQASKSVTITFDDETATTVTADEYGVFTATFTVPIRTAGTYKIKVSDGTNTLQSDFAIVTSASISPETSPASPGNVGTELTVSGVGFTPGRTATVTYDDTEVAEVPVNSNGTFTATFKVPATKGGNHTVVATDVINRMEFTFVMESTPPPIPPPLKPEMDIKAEAETLFDWEDVTDPSGVTYTLQIATDKDFSKDSIVLEKTGLTDSEYTLTEEEKLESVSEEEPYYWRLRAIDGAANASPWTGTGAFYVGFHFALSQTTIYVIIGVGALLFAIFAFWIGRKTAYY